MALNKEIIIFDLDGTLAVSKSPITGDMASLLCKLLDIYAVAIISGGAFTQMKEQYSNYMPCKDRFDRLFLLPTSGSSFYRWKDDTWQQEYAFTLTEEEQTEILNAIKKVRDELGKDFHHVTFEGQAENRETQVTFSALGQKALPKDKEKWDPTREKRSKMQKKLREFLPLFEVRIGGTTSIDITKPGINKGSGLKEFFKHTPYSIETSLFIGDAIFPGGNDYPAKEIGIESIRVRNPEETARVIKSILEGSLTL